MKILVTGISGRIGANLAKALLDAGHEVRGLIWANDRRLDKLAALDVELIEGTIENPADANKAVAGVDVVCHLAAAFQGGGPFSNQQYFDINVRGVFNMLEAARQHAPNLQHFFYASTDAIYEKYIPGGIPDPIQEDTMKIAPSGQYAVTKYLGEELARGYYRTYGLPVTVFRFALAVAGDEILNFGQFYLRHWISAYARNTHPEAAAVRAELQRVRPLDDAAAENCLLLARDEQGRAYKSTLPTCATSCVALPMRWASPARWAKSFSLLHPRPTPGRRQFPIWRRNLASSTWMYVWPARFLPTTNSTCARANNYSATAHNSTSSA